MTAFTSAISQNADDIYSPLYVGVATGVNTCQTNTDPRAGTWTSRTISATTAWQSVAYGNGLVVAVSSTSGTIASSSPDGTTWTARTLPSTASWYAVKYGGTTWLAVANNSTAAATSPDGVTWTAQTIAGAAKNWQSLAYGNGVFVALANQGVANELTTAVSATGATGTWTNNTATGITSTGNWTSITFGGGYFVAVCSGSTAAAYSTDGLAWTLSNALPASTTWVSVCWGNGTYVAVSSASTNVAATSSDGITWASSTLSATSTWRFVIYGKNLIGEDVFYAAGATTVGSYSVDNGATWAAKTQVTMTYTAGCYAPLTWFSNDTLTIDNGATVTVNTDQKKFWATVAITNGKLLVTNSSTSTGIRFVMGRASGTGAATITPASGLGTIEFQGNWIELGTGSGSSGQTMTAPFTDYIPALWVETASGSGVYEQWLNVTGKYGDADPVFYEGLSAVGSGTRGKFFTQGANAAPYGPLTLTSASGATAQRRITVTSTTGLYVGASVSGTNITANSVVTRIVSSTQFEVSLVTAGAVSGSLTCYNPFAAQLTATITFGDDVNGNKVPTGAKVRCPNIMVTVDTPANIQTASNLLGVSAVMTNGGSYIANIALFDESYNNFTQAQTVTLTNVGYSIIPLLAECYAVTMNSVGFALQPKRRYYTSSWLTRDTTFGQFATWSYINGASITDLNFCVNSPSNYISTAPALTSGGLIALSVTEGATFDHLRVYSLNTARSFQYGLNCTSLVNSCTFSNLEFYGVGAVVLNTSSSNTFTTITVAEDMFSGYKSFPTAGSRIGTSPLTQDKLVNNTKYYFKVRSFRTWNNLNDYYEGRVVSATPFLASTYFPAIWSAYNSASTTVTFNWIRHDPTAASLAYEIYRGTSPGFTLNAAARIYSTATVATITTTDATVSNGTTYYYVFKKYDAQWQGITNSSGSGSQPVVTTSQNFHTGLGTIAQCYGTSGSNKVRLSSGVATNFLTTVCPGMRISGTGIPASTTVVSVDHALQITLSANLTQDIFATTLSLGACVGMNVTGTGIAVATKVLSVDSTTQITLDTNTTGTVSGTLTFLYGNQSAETEVFVSGAAATSANIVLQNSVFGTTWAATTMTVTADAITGPVDSPFGTAATLTADNLAATSTNGFVTQNVTTVNGTQYTFSVYVRCNVTATQQSVAGVLSLGTATQAFTATSAWTKISVTFTATGVSTAAKIQVNTSGQQIHATAAMVNTGATAKPPIATTTSTVTLNPAAQEFNVAYAWCRSTGGETTNSGIELGLAAAPTGTLWSEIYMGTTSGFTPSTANRIGSTLVSTQGKIYLTNSNGNTFTTLTQAGCGGMVNTLVTLIGSSNNTFKNFTYDFNYSNAAIPWNITALSNTNLFHNFLLKNYKNYTATLYPLSTANNASGVTFQNCNFDTYDFAWNNQSLNTILKGVSGGNATPATNATTYTLGSTTDSMAIAYTAVYDMIFNELYFSTTTGALHLNFNASSKAVKPYTVLSGTPTFSNTGRLYFQNIGDSIEYVWPHEILGVSGFRDIVPKLNGLDLGTANDEVMGIKIEFAVNTGSGYGAYQTATAANLSATSVSASTGFYLKLKLTARAGMKYSGMSSQFVINETINGLLSGATAVVRENNNILVTGTGTIIVDTITGTFIAGETIRSGVTTRATNVATNTNFALFPSFTSYVDALEIFTTVDSSVIYPTTSVTITLTNVISGSNYYIYKLSDSSLVASGTASSSTVTITGVLYDSNFDVVVRVRKSTDSVTKYEPYETQASVTSAGASVFIAQVIDTIAEATVNASIAADFTVSTAYKTITHVSGETPIYTVNEFYTYLMNYFADSARMDDTTPISAQTPTEYTITNGWFLDNLSTHFLSGGALQTSGWASGVIRLKAYDATGAGVAFGPTDIGKVITETDSGDTGVLLDYDERTATEIGYVWIRPDTAGDTFADVNSAYTVATSSAAGVFTAASTTGENIWSNIFSLGSLVAGTTLDVYRNDLQLTPWWSSGHIDILVRVKEMGTEIDSGNLTVLARLYGTLYDHYLIDASTGRNPVPLAAFDDGNNDTSSGTVGAYAGFTFTFGYASKNLGNGNGAQPYDCVIECNSHTLLEVYEYLKYVTRTGSGTTLNGVNGEYYTAVGDIRLNYTGETSGPFVEGNAITSNVGGSGYIVSVLDNGTTGTLTIRNVHGTFANSNTLTSSGTTATVSGTPDSIIVSKQSPFGTFAGGTFFGARGVWLDNVAGADANNYILIDSTGATQAPPNTVAITVGGVEAGDKVSVFRATDTAGSINRTYMTSHNTANTVGLSTFQVNAIPVDTPTTGRVRIRNSAGTIEHHIRYASWTGTTFTLRTAVTGTITAIDDVTGRTFYDTNASLSTIQPGDLVRNTTDGSWAQIITVTNPSGDDYVFTHSPLTGGSDNEWDVSDNYSFHTLPQGYDNTYTAYVPYLDTVATGTSVSVSVTYSADRNISTQVRRKGIIPFTTNAISLTSTGYTATAVRTTDSIVT